MNPSVYNMIFKKIGCFTIYIYSHRPVHLAVVGQTIILMTNESTVNSSGLPDRILFGSDLPITRMRMKRITEDGRYINIVPKGLYGVVSNDPHMREIDGEESESLTFFIYEEIEAFRIAAQNTHLTKDEIKNVFHGNAQRILHSAGSD